MNPVYLLDASSFFKALKEAKLESLGGQALQWLTVYEVLNAFWKETHLLRRLTLGEAVFLANVFEELVQNMVILNPSGLEHDILKIAVSKKITVYDASYIALARKHRLTLVTEDQKLFQAANGIAKVASLDDIT